MTESYSSLWKKCLAVLSASLPPHHLDTWIKPMKLRDLEDQRLTLEVPSAFFKEWITHHHLPMIQQVLNEVAGSPIDVAVIASPVRNDGLSPIFHQSKISMPQGEKSPADGPGRTSESPNTQAIRMEDAPSLARDPLLTNPEFRDAPHYTFESFVVGNANRFAHAAGMAVAENPGKSYNPLFIYGGSGLGKTHLLRAVGHEILLRAPRTKVLYLTCEGFMNEMIASIRGGHEKMVGFRRKFRQADVLLIDDIQFLEGKESTQEEFFHTFNELYESHRQIVASSDSHPKEISLEGRLRSRFEMGLIADIQPPDYETRVAILQKKAEQEQTPVSEEILCHLATHMTSNIRQLEGALVRLLAIATLSGRPLTLGLAEEIVTDVTGSSAQAAVTIDQIKRVVALHFHITPVEFISKKRTRRLASARQIAMYLSRELTAASLPEIGRAFGGRDHTTILYACEVVQERLSTDSSTAQHLHDLFQQLRPST